VRICIQCFDTIQLSSRGANNATPVVGTSIQLRQKKLTCVTCTWSNYEIPGYMAETGLNRRKG